MTERVEESMPSPEAMNSAISTIHISNEMVLTTIPSRSKASAEQTIQSSQLLPYIIMSQSLSGHAQKSPCENVTVDQETELYDSNLFKTDSQHTMTATDTMTITEVSSMEGDKTFFDESDVSGNDLQCDNSWASTPSSSDSIISLSFSFNDSDDDSFDMDMDEIADERNGMVDNVEDEIDSMVDNVEDGRNVIVDYVDNGRNGMVDNVKDGRNGMMDNIDNGQPSQMSANFNETINTNSHINTISTYQCPSNADVKTSKSSNGECIGVTCDDITFVTGAKEHLDVLKNAAFEKKIVPNNHTTDVISGFYKVETQMSDTQPLQKETSSRSNENDQEYVMTTQNMIEDGVQQHQCDAEDVNSDGYEHCSSSVNASDFSDMFASPTPVCLFANKSLIQAKVKQNNSDLFMSCSNVDKISTSTNPAGNKSIPVNMICNPNVSTNMDQTGQCFSDSLQLSIGNIKDFNKSLLSESMRGIQHSVIKEENVTEDQMSIRVCPVLQTAVSAKVSNNIETPSSFDVIKQTTPFSMPVTKVNLFSNSASKSLKSVIYRSHPRESTLLLGKSDVTVTLKGSKCDGMPLKSSITPVHFDNSHVELKGNSEKQSNHSSTDFSMLGSSMTKISKDSNVSFPGSIIKPCTVIAGQTQTPILSVAVPIDLKKRTLQSILTTRTPITYPKQSAMKKKPELIYNQIAMKKLKEAELMNIRNNNASVKISKTDDAVVQQNILENNKPSMQYVNLSSGGKTIVSPRSKSTSVYTNSILKPRSSEIPPVIYRLDATFKNPVSTSTKLTTESTVPILVKNASGTYSFAYLSINNDGIPKSKPNENYSIIPKVNTETSVNMIKLESPTSSLLNCPTSTKLVKDNSISPTMSNSSTVPTMTSRTSMINLTRLLTSNLNKSSVTTTCINMSSEPISSVTSVLPTTVKQQNSRNPKDKTMNVTLSELRKTKKLVEENLELLQKTNCGSKEIFDSYSNTLKTIADHENSMFNTSTMVNQTLKVPPNDCVTSIQTPLVTHVGASLPQAPLFSQVSKVPPTCQVFPTKLTSFSSSGTKVPIPVRKQSENQIKALNRPIVVKVVYGLKEKFEMTTHDQILDESTGQFRTASFLNEKDRTLKNSLSVPKETIAVYNTTKTNTIAESSSAESCCISSFAKTSIKSWFSKKSSASSIPCTEINSTLANTLTNSSVYTSSVPSLLPSFNKSLISSYGNLTVSSQLDNANIVSSFTNTKLVTCANTKVVSSLPKISAVSPYASKRDESQFSKSNGISPRNSVPSKSSSERYVPIDTTAGSSLLQSIPTTRASTQSGRVQKLIPYYSLYDKDFPHKRLPKDPQNYQSITVPISIPSTVIQSPGPTQATTNATVNILAPSTLFRQNDFTADGFNCASDRYCIASKQSAKVQKLTPYYSLYDQDLPHKRLPKDSQNYQSITVPISIPSTVIQSPAPTQASTNATVNILAPSSLFKQNDFTADDCNCGSDGCNCASDGYGIKIDSVYSLRQDDTIPENVVRSTRSFLRDGSETETDDEGEQVTYFSHQFDCNIQKARVKLSKAAKEDDRLRKPCYVVLQDFKGNLFYTLAVQIIVESILSEGCVKELSIKQCY